MNNKYRFLLPSVADAFFFAIFLRLCLVVGQSLLDDADTGYHIRSGEFILNTRSIPKHDIFSFLSPPLPWTAHEWLSEVIMALVHRALGLTGIVLFFSFIIALTYALLFKTLQIHKGNIIFSALLVSLAMVASQLHWLARPHIFSLLLSVLWYHILDLYQYKNQNRLYWLPPLMLLWVNLHGGFMFGFILLGAYITGNIGTFTFSADNEREISKLKVKTFASISLACLLVSLINPYGYHILLFPFKLASDRFLMDNVQEFLSPNFHWVTGFEYLLLLLIGVFAISGTRLSFIELLLILLLTHMALYSARYILLFAIVVVPILSRQASQLLAQIQGRWVDFFKTRSNGIALLDASARGYLWPIMALLIVSFSVATGRVEHKFDERLRPIKAVEFIKKENLQGNMFNSDDFGNYIIYAVWPKYKVFFDGRSDMYGSSHIREYFKVAEAQRGWEAVLAKYNITWVIFNANSVLSTLLSNTDGWRLIYADTMANIFVKDIPQYQSLLQKYPNVKPASSNGTTD